MMDWIAWVFSGIGVFIIAGIWGLIRRRLNRGAGDGQAEVPANVRAAVHEIDAWAAQVTRVLTELQENQEHLRFEDFKETLNALRLQYDNTDQVGRNNLMLSSLLSSTCPDFQRYAEARGHLERLAQRESNANSGLVQQFLEFCEEAEEYVVKIKNPGYYDVGHPCRVEVLVEAVEGRHALRRRASEFVGRLR